MNLKSDVNFILTLKQNHAKRIHIKNTCLHWNVKKKALDYTLWRTCFERGYGSVA
jgi:hypothetical protein